MLPPAVFFDTAELDRWLAEDIGVMDLTSLSLPDMAAHARIDWVSRADQVAACTEEAARLAERCGASVTQCLDSGTRTAHGDVLLRAEGPSQGVLYAWKVVQNLLEYACGVATRTARMVEAVHAVNPDVGVLTTRKHPPGLRRTAIKATLAGGASPHRLGLSETLLVFPQHLALLGGNWQHLGDALRRERPSLVEKRIVIEATSMTQARAAIAAGAEIVQFDKATPDQLTPWCSLLRAEAPAVRLLAAGGIRPDNAAAYAASGVDALVTSSLYYGPPGDVGVTIQPLSA